MSVDRPPVAFLSYTRSVDKHQNRRITHLRERLEGAVRDLMGDESFYIFQDHIHIKWGEDWKKRIAESLNDAMLLIPVITEGFFKSTACCDELDCFIEREKKLGRTDLILPLYYIDSDTLSSSRNGVGLRVGLLERFSAAVTRRARLIVAYSIDFVLVFPTCGQTPGVMRRAPGRA